MTLLLPVDSSPSLVQSIACASVWTLLEWSRLFVFCGLPFNMVGYALTAFSPSSQFAAAVGVLGLSFIVMVLNLLALKCLQQHRLKDIGVYFGGIVLIYGLGWIHLQYHQRKMEKNASFYEVALVQTGLRPEQKVPLRDQEHLFISPFEQWINIILELENSDKKQWNLIVLPEAAVPYGAYFAIYPIEDVQEVLKTLWGTSCVEDLPKLEENVHEVSNMFWVQALANHYRSEVIIGLDDSDEILDTWYNAAFYMPPHVKEVQRYEKCILVPLAEYLPIKWLEPLVQKYGITNFATHGRQAKIFGQAVPMSASVCYEECFGHFMRQGRKQGAKLFVNVTNDGWYLPSKLPEQHFHHARVRSIENGVPLVRACNTGITAIVDSLGNTCARLPAQEDGAIIQGVLSSRVPLYHYSTLYTVWGDALIVSVCGVGVLVWVFVYGVLRKGVARSYE